jgi:hypothetical protein
VRTTFCSIVKTAIGIGCTAALLVLPSEFAIAQKQRPSEIVTEGTVEFIPPVARAVLTGDPKQVADVLQKEPHEGVNQKVQARKGNLAGYTPLILAAAISNVDIAIILLSHGANIGALDDFHRSALWYAAFHDDTAVTKALLEAPTAAEVVNEADNNFKRTPLHLAVRGDNADVVELLMEHGAAKSEAQKDILGQTPADYCKRDVRAGCKYLQ